VRHREPSHAHAAPRRSRAAGRPAAPAAADLGAPGTGPEGDGGFLERDQLVLDKSRPVGRARLGRGARAGLWAMRLAVMVLGAMVIYTFVSQVA
jgi:hypothetical protein